MLNDDPIQQCNFEINMEELRKDFNTVLINSYDDKNTAQTKQYRDHWKCIELYDSFDENNNLKQFPATTKEPITVDIRTYTWKQNTLLDGCDYLKKLLNDIGADGIYQCKISKLSGNSSIGLHTDQTFITCYANEKDFARFHIPIITNDMVHFTISNKTYNMKEGILYKLRTGTCIHGVENLSNDDRYHLIIDLDPNKINKNLIWTEPSQSSR